MKRLLVLLVLLAGGLAAAALLVPTNAAVVNGTAISQQTLNSDVSAIAGSADYQCYLNSQTAISSSGQSQLPSVGGAGRGQGGQHATATTAFTANYLDTEVAQQLVYQVADHRGVTVTSAQLADARNAYAQNITQVMEQAAQSQDPRYTCGSATPLTGEEVLSTLPTSFVDSQVHFYATSAVLEEDLAGVGASDTDLQGYFERNSSQFDTVCWTVGVYTSESAASAALTQAQNTPFSEVVKQATQGGAEPCEPLPDVTASLPSGVKLDELSVGAVSLPISAGNGEYLLMQITSRHPTEYANVKTLVAQAVQQKGATKTQAALSTLERHSTINIDPRYGVWVPAAAQVSVPFTPQTTDVLNADANNATPTSATASPASG
jgi:PPIC-type PPIASE domain